MVSEWVSEWWWWWWWLVGWVGLGGWVDCIKFSHHLLCNSYVHTNHTSHSCFFQPLCRGKLWAWSQLFIQHMPIGGPPKIIKFWQFWIWVQELSSSPLINLSGGGEWVSEWVMMMVVVGWLVGLGWVGGWNAWNSHTTYFEFPLFIPIKPVKHFSSAPFEGQSSALISNFLFSTCP